MNLLMTDEERAARQVAAVKAGARGHSAAPTANGDRIRHYVAQRGYSSSLTPRQLRRCLKKEQHRMARALADAGFAVRVWK